MFIIGEDFIIIRNIISGQTEQLMEKGFRKSGDEEPDGHSNWASWSYVEKGEIYRRTNITASLHRSGLYGGVAKLNSLLSEDTWKYTWNLQKST